MKISVILKVLLFFNSTVLFAEIISKLMKELNIWSLVAIEAILIIGYFKKNVLTEVRRLSKINVGNRGLFTGKNKRSA